MATAKGEATRKDVEDAIDALFQLPLADFTTARNALAARLKRAGDAQDADRVKALPKPSIAAWVVNQLYFKHRAAFDRLIAAGERFRTAQGAQLAGKSADMRAPLEARRTALSELTKLAAGVLRHGGSNASPDMMRRVMTTLEALSTYAGLPDAPRAGRLADDVDPPGFETLAALVPRTGKSGHQGPSRIIPFAHKAKTSKTPSKAAPKYDGRRAAAERTAQVAAAKAALQQAERELRDARKAAQRAEQALKRAAAQAKAVEAEKRKAEERLEKAAADADSARQDARRVAADAEEAAQAVADAERAVEKAQRELEATQTP